MKTRPMRQIVAALGLGIAGIGFCTGAHAQAPASDGKYRAPAKWSHFRAPVKSPSQTPADLFGAAVVQQAAAQAVIEQLPPPPSLDDNAALPVPTLPAQESLPAPAPTVAPMPPAPGTPAPPATPQVPATPVAPAAPAAPLAASTHATVADPATDAACSSCGHSHASYSQAGAGCGNCSLGPRGISPWFGGFDLMWLDFEETGDRSLLTDDAANVLLRSNRLGATNTMGFDTHIGRYFGCGRFGMDFRFFYFNPNGVSRSYIDGGAGLRLTIPALRDASIDRGAGAATVYDEFDAAARIRSTRDIGMVGFEANLHTFGLMGARRLGSCRPTCLVGSHGHGYYGGATGPLARACKGRARIQALHGFRWFKLEDRLEIVGDVDGNAGYQDDDLFYDIETENNLFGYQFGAIASWCITERILFNLGGKIGIYGNDVEYRQRIGTQSILGFTNTQGAGAGDISTTEREMVVAGLGEFDLGLGYRWSNRWTTRFGYRMLTACGVATSVGQIPTEYTSVQSAGMVRADDCLLVHGGYFGIDYNW